MSRPAELCSPAPRPTVTDPTVNTSTGAPCKGKAAAAVLAAIVKRASELGWCDAVNLPLLRAAEAALAPFGYPDPMPRLDGHVPIVPGMPIRSTDGTGGTVTDVQHGFASIRWRDVPAEIRTQDVALESLVVDADGCVRWRP